MKYDFGGYATKNDTECSDGRTIRYGAFKECDGKTVPLVWQHMHDSVDNVLGHAMLENREDGVYAYCTCNETPSGQQAKELVQHGDIVAMSIYANRLQQRGNDVMHGVIREVSLVLSGANPGALIDNLSFAHSDGSIEESADEAIIYFDNPLTIGISHADDDKKDEESEETIGDIFDTLSDKQKEAVYAIIGTALEEAGISDDDEMEHADGEKTVQDVFDTLSEEQKQAAYALIGATLQEYGITEDDIEHSDADAQILAHADAVDSDKTVQEVFDTFTDEQKQAVYAIIGATLQEHGITEDDLKHSDTNEYQEFVDTLTEEQVDALDALLDAFDAGKEPDPEVMKILNQLSDDKKNFINNVLSGDEDDEDGEEDTDGAEDESSEDGETDGAGEGASMAQSDHEGEIMKFNVFDDTNEGKTLAHSDVAAIFADAKRTGSLKDACLQHGITNVGVLFPEAKTVNNTPEMISRPMEWVAGVLASVHRSPFSKVKSIAANLTADEARARGYITGTKKIEEQISALHREVTPQTIYKLQKLDRDDIIDITDFDVVAWLKQEMRMMLDEEIARAILVGDGRLVTDPSKIKEANIIPVWNDAETYTVHTTVDGSLTGSARAKAFIDSCIRARKYYKGSGAPTLYVGTDLLTEMRLIRDDLGYRLYKNDQELADELRVSKIVEIQLLDGLTRTDTSSNTFEFGGLILNLADYNVGATRGGEVNLFDDFDLDYNKYEYLIETRMSGALIRPKSALAVEFGTVSNGNEGGDEEQTPGE